MVHLPKVLALINCKRYEVLPRIHNATYNATKCNHAQMQRMQILHNATKCKQAQNAENANATKCKHAQNAKNANATKCKHAQNAENADAVLNALECVQMP